MTPEDKAMTEKAMMSGNNTQGVAGKMLLKDLPSSTIDTAAAVIAKKEDTKEEAKTDTKAVPPPLADAPFNPATPPPIATPPPEPKKKGFLNLPFFHRKPKETVVPQTKTTEVAEQLTNESLIKMIDDKLHKISGDEFILIKISKQGLLILVGLILVAIWLMPLIELNLPKVLNSRYQLLAMMQGKTPESSPETAPSPTPIPLTDSTIRVRMGSNSLDAANEIKGLLMTAGFSHIDLVYDPQVNPKSLLIVTKRVDETLQQSLKQLFIESYDVASEAAELTSDSDFDASILVGKSAKLAK